MPIDLEDELRRALLAVRGELAEIVEETVRRVLRERDADGDPHVLVDVREAARILGTTEGALRRRIERGHFPVKVTRMGRTIRLVRVEILRLARSDT